MARSRRAAAPSLVPPASNAVLQGVRNTTSRTSRPSKQKHDVSGKDTTADKQSASKSRFAVAKQVSRPPRASRKPLSSISTNRRTTTTRKNDKASSKQASQHAQQLSSPEHFISSVETIPTQPIEHSSRRVPGSARAPSVVATGTPSAVEQSMLVLKSFKRRPRQPSMLNMVKQRLASARSSIAADAISMSSEDDSLNLDDFNPDAAGTPLISSCIHPMAPATSPGRKRRRSGDVDEPESTPRKLRKLVSQSDAGDDAGLASSHSEDMQLRISVTPELEPNEDTDDSITGLNISELAAGTSPVSQSSEPGSPAIVAVASQSSIYGPPVSQHTPPPQRHTRATRSKAPSSAVLQSLLPRRRKQFAAAFPVSPIRLSTADLEQRSDEEEPVDDAEEHSEFVSTTRQRTKKAKQHKKKTNTSKKAPSNKIAAAKTYGRRKTQPLKTDQEDTDLDLQDSTNSTSLTLEDVSKNQELEAARKAFADIDKWEMEYETLTNEDSRDSSQGWR